MLAQANDTTCPSCGQNMEEKFCFRCDEKRNYAHSFSLKQFVKESFEGITHFDGKAVRTFKLILFSQ